MPNNPCRNPRVLGLTGGVGAGKSTARHAFAALGVPTLDADAVARRLHQDPAHPATRNIAKAFPDWMTADGRLQRGSLMGFFARDAAANRVLIGILKPHVHDAMQQWTAAQTTPYVVWESALMLQAGIAVDRLLAVHADTAMRMERMRRRNPDWSAQQIESLMAMQALPAPPSAIPSDKLHNDGTPEDLAQQVADLHHHYLSLWS